MAGAGGGAGGWGGRPREAESCGKQMCQAQKLEPVTSRVGWGAGQGSRIYHFNFSVSKILSSAKQNPSCSTCSWPRAPERGPGSSGISRTRSQGPNFWKCLLGRACGFVSLSLARDQRSPQFQGNLSLLWRGKQPTSPQCGAAHLLLMQQSLAAGTTEARGQFCPRESRAVWVRPG